MNIEDFLNKYQQQRIIERSKLIYDEELYKSKILPERIKFSKNIRSQLDILINELYQDGVMFYGLKMTKPYITSENPKMWYYIHLQTEYFINQLKDDIELIEFCYLSVEKNNTEITPYFYGVIGVRTLVGKNSFHFNEMKKNLDDTSDEVSIKSLKTVKSIKKYWEFVIRKNNYKFHRFVHYSNNYQDLYGSIADLELQYDPIKHYAFCLDQMLDCKHSSVAGINLRLPSPKTLIIFFLNLYFYSKNYRICDDKVFLKNKNSRFSWDMIYTLDELNKNYALIFEFLKSLYPQQLGRFNITELILSDWDFVFDKIKKNNNLVPKIKFTRRFIEFEDGIFNIEEKKFISFSQTSENLDFDTNCYLPVKYQSIDSAVFWLQFLADEKCSDELYEQFVANIKKESNIQNKRIQ